jgi:hypothetical protein
MKPGTQGADDTVRAIRDRNSKHVQEVESVVDRIEQTIIESKHAHDIGEALAKVPWTHYLILKFNAPLAPGTAISLYKNFVGFPKRAKKSQQVQWARVTEMSPSGIPIFHILWCVKGQGGANVRSIPKHWQPGKCYVVKYDSTKGGEFLLGKHYETLVISDDLDVELTTAREGIEGHYLERHVTGLLEQAKPEDLETAEDAVNDQDSNG